MLVQGSFTQQRLIGGSPAGDGEADRGQASGRIKVNIHPAIEEARRVFDGNRLLANGTVTQQETVVEGQHVDFPAQLVPSRGRWEFDINPNFFPIADAGRDRVAGRAIEAAGEGGRTGSRQAWPSAKNRRPPRVFVPGGIDVEVLSRE